MEVQMGEQNQTLQPQAQRQAKSTLIRPTYALQEAEGSPGLYKLVLCDQNYTPQDSIPESPPPSYRKHELPDLKIAIPNRSPGNPHSNSPDSAESQNSQTSWLNLDYVSQQFLEKAQLAQSNESGIREESKSKNKKRLTRVPWLVSIREKGVKIRLKRSSGDINPSHQEIRLHSVAPSPICPPSVHELENEGTSQGSPAVYELDSTPIIESPSETLGEEAHLSMGRSDSFSSVVPSPKLGISVLRRDRKAELPSPCEDIGDVVSQLLPLSAADAVSPCSPISPFPNSSSGASLKRSKALLERSPRHFLVSSSPSEPVSANNQLPQLTSSTGYIEDRLPPLPRLRVPDTPISRRVPPLEQFDTGEDSNKEVMSLQLTRQATSRTSDAEGPYKVDSWFSHPRSAIDNDGQFAEPFATYPTPESFYPHQQEHHITQSSQAANGPQLSSPGHLRRSPALAFLSAAWQALLVNIAEMALSVQNNYGSEPPVPPGHVRVRWTCACGQHIYDDYIENRPGAAAELQAHLNRQYVNWPATPSSSHPSSAGSAVWSAGGPSPLSSQSSWSSQASNAPTKWTPSDVSKYPTRVGTSAFNVNLRPFIQPLWLFTCLNEGKWTTKMRHLDVNSSKVTSDKDLALSLSSLYNHVNRKWYKLFKLRGLINISFVQFELHRNRYADISRVPSIPIPGQSDYEFQPNDLVPPVGSTYLMHLFKHPEDYDDELITYLRTPKRRERLEVGTGWGLQLVEGFLPERIWMLVLSLFGLGSLVFAIVWAVKKDDIQGAFGVAAWMLTAAALGVGWVQTWVD